MKTIKVSELSGAALDWAVAKCEGFTLYEDAMLNGITKRGAWLSGLSIDPNTWTPLAMFTPSTDWAQGGPIIEQEGLYLCLKPLIGELDEKWMATDRHGQTTEYGPTLLITAMRCYVASKLGDEV